ncbi:pilus assembly protein TadG-related protein [Streptomyces cocklensis]|jgi:hypothetical protein|uniref:Flp pilus-assembly TadE/G-like n=1 Tax=Actinacidiphila cocklensis TaxID=887465 RepID=A0A9W4GSZ1_9ACTN|nr:pilus assembly protein TadG-related protein [Actinacidiphila cocklensis]CAG6394140.1 Putative Flp pilus-assembly TadE/G-like [Actinacidiphila cocklensis]
MAALFFLAFAFFAVGQASVARNGAQTAADAAALAAARADRDAVGEDFLAALTSGDLGRLSHLLTDLGQHDESACGAAADYAGRNGAEILAGGCVPAEGLPGYTVTVRSIDSVGKSVVDGTEEIHAKATATAVVSPRCVLGSKRGSLLGFTCDNQDVTVDPTSDTFRLDLSTFYTVHLSR